MTSNQKNLSKHPGGLRLESPVYAGTQMDLDYIESPVYAGTQMGSPKVDTVPGKHADAFLLFIFAEIEECSD